MINQKPLVIYKNGFIEFSVSENVVDNILKIFNKEIEKFEQNASMGKVKREDLQINSGYKVHRVCNILNKEFESKKLFNSLNRYMGNDYEVSGLSIEMSHENSTWWKDSYSQTDNPKTLYYHFDESFKHPKAIIYLSDVDEQNGNVSICKNFEKIIEIDPLKKVIGRAILYVGRAEESKILKYYNHIYHQTFGCPIFRQDFSQLPNELKFNSHFGFDIIPKSLLEEEIMKNEYKYWEKGTSILFDGARLLHRGGMVKKGKRIAIQVVLSKKEKFKLLKKIKNKLLK